MSFLAKNVNCRISVRGLRTETKINDVFEVFQDFGSITSCRLITDKRNESKGYCFISYSKPEEAEIALNSMNGKRFDGATLNIVYATVQNDMKFDDPELRDAKIPSSHREGRGPPTENNWERHFINTVPDTPLPDNSNYVYNNSLQNSLSHPAQSQFPPPPPPILAQQRQNMFPPPPPPPSLISQPQQKMVPPPPPPLSLISQQQKQQNPMPPRSNYQHSPSPPNSGPPHSQSHPHQQYQPPPPLPQAQSRQPYRPRDFNYTSPDDFTFEQEFQREYQYRISGGAPGPRTDDPSRYQHYPPQDQHYPPHPGQRPGPGYGRPPPPPPPYLPPQQRLYQGHRHDRQPPQIPPPPPPSQHEIYFESD